MPRSPRPVLFLASLLLLAACGSDRNAAPSAADTPYGGARTRKIVVLKDGAGDPALVAARCENDYAGQRGFLFQHVFNGFSIELPESAVDAMTDDDRIAYVADDDIFEATPFIVEQVLDALPAAQTLPSGIDRIDGEKTRTAAAGGTPAVTIAVLDTGIDLDHPELNVVESVSFVGDDSRGDDKYGHGTHVAGIIAARNNDDGVVGVVPGAKLWSVKVLDDNGRGLRSQIIAGIEYVTQHAGEIDVVNMSLGGTGKSDGNCGATSKDPYHAAVCASVAKGIVYAVSAGNAAADSAGYVPAAFPEVLTVSAIADSDGKPGGLGAETTRGKDDALASFSNFGAAVDIAAPGVSITSTYPDGKYAVLSGTSMASPHVAGAAALYILRNRAAKPTTAAGLATYAQTVQQALTDAAYHQGSAGYFTGDRDAHAEPLLNVETLDPMQPITRALTVTLTGAKESYRKDTDLTVDLTAAVRTERGNPATSARLTGTLNGKTVTLTAAAVAGTPGSYTVKLDTAALSVGANTLIVRATDSRNATGTATVRMTLVAKVAKSMHVHEIKYQEQVDTRGARSLRITVAVRDENGAALRGVTVAVSATRGTSFRGSASNTTDTSGVTAFLIRNPVNGCYALQVTSLAKSGQTWDKASDAKDPGYCRGSGSGSGSGAGNTPGQAEAAKDGGITAEG